MSPEEMEMHKRAAIYYGKMPSCIKANGKPKARFDTELEAEKSAHSLSISFIADYEAYPCPFCNKWHAGRKMTAEERAMFSDPEVILPPMDTIEIEATDPVFGYSLGVKKLKVHNPVICAGRSCSVHNPSDHHMKDWPLNWRSDRRIMERLCTHYNDDGSVSYQIGHPDPDDADFRERRDGDNYDPGTHGCDGCCFPPQVGSV
jgi:hypothetical protein